MPLLCHWTSYIRFWESRIYFAYIEVTWAILQNLSESLGLFSYLLIHQKFRVDGLIVDRDTERILLKVPEVSGVAHWSSHCLARRTYESIRPNYPWHVDGYDKSKPYGSVIHGTIDGFSWKIFWLRVRSSNNN